MTTETRSLHRKLAQVMHEVGRIPKNGTAPQAMGGYKFVQVGDAADAIRAALAEKVITMMPTAVRVVGQVDRPTKSGGTMTTVDLVTTWTLTDGESGETLTIESFGAGADGGDKYSGKASTSAMKYALLTGFLLSTGEDSELGGPEAGRPANRPPQPSAGPITVGTTEVTSDGGLIGTAIIQGNQDANLRQTPDGFVLPFRVKNGSKSFIVVAENELAQALELVRDQILDKRVTVHGNWTDETIPAKGTKPEIKYRILHLTRISTPDFILPAPGIDEPPEDLPLVGEKPEAMPPPLFDDVDAA